MNPLLEQAQAALKSAPPSFITAGAMALLYNEEAGGMTAARCLYDMSQALHHDGHADVAHLFAKVADARFASYFA